MVHKKISLEFEKEMWGFEPSYVMPWDMIGENNASNIELAKEVVSQIIRHELTELQKAMITKKMQGMSTGDIAKQLGITSPTVSTHYRKGIETLKRFGQYIAPFLR